MAISDTERRGVAARLRDLDEHIDGVPPMCSPQVHNAMALSAIRAVVGKGDIFHLLADLIDRPMCHNVYDEREMGACANGFECSVCGNRVEDFGTTASRGRSITARSAGRRWLTNDYQARREVPPRG